MDVLAVMGNGLRFDMRVAFCLTIPAFLSSIACGLFTIDRIVDRLRLFSAAFFSVVTLFLCIATIFYFKEYQDQFNHWIFGLFFDDSGAILKTLWSQTPVVPSLFAFAAGAAILIMFLKSFLHPGIGRHAQNSTLWFKLVATFGIILWIAVASRGSIGRRPVEMKDVGVTKDVFLNRIVLNPYEAIRYALQDFRDARSAKGLKKYLQDEDIRKAVKTLFNKPHDLDVIDDYMLCRAHGRAAVRPRHIFLIVMESYDTWPMLDKYSSLQTSTMLTAIAEKGIRVHTFLPASDGTMTSLATLIAGLPNDNLNINYQLSAKTPFPTAIAPIMKTLGYKTRFFYGGYLSWQRIEEFCRNQGFEEIYGAPHMGRWLHANEWGVDDEILFQFVEKTIDNTQPSFSMIMSTSYHPPYDIDVFKLGYPVRTIPSELAKAYNGEHEMKIFGHLWYADRCLGNFVEKMENKLSAPVFAITGDHSSRKFIGRPTAFERHSVPLVLYGPETIRNLKVPENTVGSHIDMLRTVVELAAPAGFEYHSMGSDLFDTSAPSIAVAANFVILTPGHIIETPGRPVVEKISGDSGMIHDADMKRIMDHVHRYYAAAWWRVMRGPELP